MARYEVIDEGSVFCVVDTFTGEPELYCEGEDDAHETAKEMNAAMSVDEAAILERIVEGIDDDEILDGLLDE
jgi:hypothetical protein